MKKLTLAFFDEQGSNLNQYKMKSQGNMTQIKEQEKNFREGADWSGDYQPPWKRL